MSVSVWYWTFLSILSIDLSKVSVQRMLITGDDIHWNKVPVFDGTRNEWILKMSSVPTSCGFTVRNKQNETLSCQFPNLTLSHQYKIGLAHNFCAFIIIFGVVTSNYLLSVKTLHRNLFVIPGFLHIARYIYLEFDELLY